MNWDLIAEALLMYQDALNWGEDDWYELQWAIGYAHEKCD